MALNTLGKDTILQNIKSTFVQVAVGGTFTKPLEGTTIFDFDLPALVYGATPTVEPEIGRITYASPTVFTVTLTDTAVFPGGVTLATIRYVRLLNSTGTELMKRNFGQAYDYAGNGTFTVTSIIINLT